MGVRVYESMSTSKNYYYHDHHKQMNSFAQRMWFLILLPYHHHHQHTSSSCCFDCFVCLMPPFFNTRSLSISSAWRLYNYSLFTLTHLYTHTYNIQQCKQTNVDDDDKWHDFFCIHFSRFFLCKNGWEKIVRLVRCVYIFPLQQVVRFIYYW